MQKKLPILLIGLMVLTIFAGCSNGSPSESEAPEISTPTMSNAAPAETENPTPITSPAETEEPVQSIPAASVLTGSAEDALQAVFNSAPGYDISMTIDNAITAENVKGFLNLTKSEFEKYFEEGIASSAALSSDAHMVVILKCKGTSDSSAAAKLLAEKFTSARWVCVMPEKCYVVYSGGYVMLVASGSEIGNMLLEGFRTASSDSAAEQNVFYESPAN